MGDNLFIHQNEYIKQYKDYSISIGQKNYYVFSFYFPFEKFVKHILFYKKSEHKMYGLTTMKFEKKI